MLKQILKHIYNYPLAYLLAFAFSIRVIVLLIYNPPTLFPDSEGYITLAERLQNFNLKGYTGERTPGYPLLIALCNGNIYATIILQQLIGLLTTYFTYRLIRLNTDFKIAFWASVVYTSLLHVLFYEVIILTESTAIFALTLAFYLIKKHQLLSPKASTIQLFIISIILGFLYLVKPLFIYIPFAFTLFYIVKNWQYKRHLIKATIILIWPCIAFYSWASVNEKNIGVFGSSYFMGINLSQNATSFFEKVPDEHALIRDIFVKHRDSIYNNHQIKNNPMSIWAAYDELLEKTELTPPQLSNKLGNISIELFKNHPWLYAKQVFKSWYLFWDTNLYWNPKQMKFKFIKNICIGLWLFILRWLLIALKLVFLAISFTTFTKTIKGRLKNLNFQVFVCAIVVAGSLAQALVTYGSNPRFSFPYLVLIIYIVASNLTALSSRYANRIKT